MFFKRAHLGNNQWYLYLITIILVVIGTVLGQLPLFFISIAQAGSSGMDQDEIMEKIEAMDFAGIGMDQNLSVFLLLLSFVVALVFLWLSVKYIHNKPFNVLINPSLKVNWNKIFFAFALWMGFTILIEFVFFLMQPDIYTFQFDARKFFVLLLIAVFVFPLQTSFEELMFRGYLMQGIGLLINYRWVPLVLTSVGFGAMHFMNPEVEKFGLGLSMTYYIGVGLFLGILTLMDNGLELALGVHVATNIYSALFVTFDESAVQTAALFHTSEVNMGWMLFGFFGAAIAFILIVSKKYSWGNWSNCYGPIETPQMTDEIVYEENGDF